MLHHGSKRGAIACANVPHSSTLRRRGSVHHGVKLFRDPWSMPVVEGSRKRQAESKKARARAVGAASDHMILHHLYKDWRDVVGLTPWSKFTQPSAEAAARVPNWRAGLDFGRDNVASHPTLCDAAWHARTAQSEAGAQGAAAQ